jgi:hypothetical protein
VSDEYANRDIHRYCHVDGDIHAHDYGHADEHTDAVQSDVYADFDANLDGDGYRDCHRDAFADLKCHVDADANGADCRLDRDLCRRRGSTGDDCFE